MAAVEVQQAQQAPVTRYQGVDKRSSGYKLLAAMGWKEGEGLGAARQGIKEHIKVKKKFENWGVGAVEAAEKARDWTTGMLDFTRVLSTLSEVTSQHARGDSGYDSSSESEGERSDASDGQVRRQRVAREAAAAAEGGEAGRKKAAGAKAGRKGALKKGKGAAGGEEGAAAAGGEEKKAGKKKKKERKSSKASEGAAPPSAKKKRKAAAAAGPGSGSSSSDSESGSNDSGSDSEGEGGAGAAAAPKRVKFATHVGRFKRREAAKMVKNYSSTDLAAILGGTSSGGAAAAAAAAVDPTMDMVFPTVEIRAQRPASSSDDDGDSSGSDEEGGSGGAAAAAAAPSGGGATSSAMATSGRSGAGASSSGEPSDSAPLEVVDAGEGTWWGGYFAKAAWRAGGRAGASGRPSITIHGFREEDQENLYNLAQDGRTQGRVGLGRSSMPKKVAGARWAGKKTRLGSDSEDEEQQEEQQSQELEQVQGGKGSDAPGEVHLGNGVVIVLPPSRRAELEPQLLQRQAAVAAAAAQQQGQQGQQQQQQGGQPAAAAGAAASKPAKQGKRRGGKGAAPAAAEALGGGASSGADLGGGASSGADLGSIKWRKLVLIQLKSSGKSKLSVSKLSKAISKQRGLGKAERARVEEMVAAAAGACSKLSLRDGVVRMTAAE